MIVVKALYVRVERVVVEHSTGRQKTSQLYFRLNKSRIRKLFTLRPNQQTQTWEFGRAETAERPTLPSCRCPQQSVGVYVTGYAKITLALCSLFWFV